MTDDDIAIFELAASLCTGYLKPEVPHNYSFNDDDLLAFARGIEARVLEELRKQEPVAWIRPSDEGYDSAFRDHSTIVSCTGNDWKGWKPLYAAPIPPTEVEPATEYAEYILDHYDRKSRKDRKLLGKHLAEWADRRYRDAVPIPPTVTTQKFLDAEQFLAAFPVSENEIYQLGHKFLRYQTHNCNEINLVEFVRAVFEAAPTPTVTPSQQEALDAKRYRWICSQAHAPLVRLGF